MKRTWLSRRTLLRGAFGTAIGVPLLECMLDGRGTAHADGSGLPCRYFLLYCPTSLVTSSTKIEAMTPLNSGFGYDIRPVLQPLADHGVNTDTSVISGLFSAPLNMPGGYNSDHHGDAPQAVMTGVRHGFHFIGEDYWPVGLSADQRVLKQIGQTTRFPSLYFQLDSQTGGTYVCIEEKAGSGGDPPVYYQYVEPQTSPSLAYRSLFMDFMPPGEKKDPRAELERRLRQSSLSYARESITALQGRLGASDKRTLDEHLTRVRDLENRIASLPPGTLSPACADPKLPANDPPDVGTDLPDQEARAALFVDLIEMAFACDMTRVLTLGGASVMTGSGMRHPMWSQAGGLHAEVQHADAQAALEQANRWFVDVYARVIARFKDTQEGAGTVLDRVAGLFVMEGGKGLSNDAQRSGDGGGDPNHSLDNSLMMLAGRAGGLKPGQHVNLTGRDWHHGSVFNAAYQALGVQGQHGEISQVVTELFEG